MNWELARSDLVESLETEKRAISMFLKFEALNISSCVIMTREAKYINLTYAFINLNFSTLRDVVQIEEVLY